MKEYRVSGQKLGILHPSSYRYIKYNNGPHPNPVPPDRLMPVETPVLFQYLRAWDRYGNKKVVLKGSQSQTLGRITGKLFVDGRLHMEGTFMASNGEASWIPDPGVLMTLYDKHDSTIRIESRFKQYNAILPGEGSFYFRNKRYKVRYLGEYSLSYLTQDTLDNQLFIEHFKFLTRDGTLSAEKPIELGSDHYANWFFHIRKPKAPPDPALARREAANQKMNQVLNKAVDEMIARKDRNFFVVESERTYISGAGNYNKRFFPSSNSEIYMFFFIIPTRYLLNLRYETKVSYTSNGKVMEEKLPTPFEKFTLNSQLTGFRQVIALPPRPRDPGTYPSLTPTIWRLANNEDIPIRVILMKRSY
jgi:hypothetical protein